MQERIALIIVVITSLSFWIGVIINKLYSNKKELNVFSLGLAFSVMIGLIVFDLIPHLEHAFEDATNFNKIASIIFYSIIGLVILKVIDLLIPHHHSEDNNDHHQHLYHVGIITTSSLILHNVVESISLYNISLINIKSGIILAIAIAIHNIPLSINIYSNLNQKNKKSYLLMLLLTISTIIGPLIISLSNLKFTEYIEGILISITLGMSLYLVIFEFLKEIKQNIKNKSARLGLALGIIIILVAHLI